MTGHDNRLDLYLLGNYGHCSRSSCLCVTGNHPEFGGAWGGLACPDWVPLGSQNVQDMIEKAKLSYLRNKNVNESSSNTKV